MTLEWIGQHVNGMAEDENGYDRVGQQDQLSIPENCRQGIDQYFVFEQITGFWLSKRKCLKC